MIDRLKDIPDLLLAGLMVLLPETRTKSVFIADSIPNIQSALFAGHKELVSVYLPDTVTSIGNYAFWYCPKLTTVIYHDVAYNSKRQLETTLQSAGVTLGKQVFENTGLMD